LGLLGLDRAAGTINDCAVGLANTQGDGSTVFQSEAESTLGILMFPLDGYHLAVYSEVAVTGTTKLIEGVTGTNLGLGSHNDQDITEGSIFTGGAFNPVAAILMSFV